MTKGKLIENMYGDGPGSRAKRRATFSFSKTPLDITKMKKVLDETLLAEKERNQKKECDTLYNKYTAASYDVSLPMFKK